MLDTNFIHKNQYNNNKIIHNRHYVFIQISFRKYTTKQITQKIIFHLSYSLNIHSIQMIIIHIVFIHFSYQIVHSFNTNLYTNDKTYINTKISNLIPTKNTFHIIRQISKQLFLQITKQTFIEIYFHLFDQIHSKLYI